MRMLKNLKRMIATVLSVTTLLTPGLAVSANDKTEGKAAVFQKGNKEKSRLPLIYNDNYFEKSAFEYNKSLATASLALELSGFAYNKGKDYSNQARSVTATLCELGFRDIQENQGYKQETMADSIGVVAANKKIKSNNEEYTLIPVVIRGGGYGNEWAGNFEMGVSDNHEGFNEAANKVKNFVDEYIKTNGNIQGKVKIWIVGYSRGGATASLLGTKFDDDFLSVLKKPIDFNKNVMAIYSDYREAEKKRTHKKYGKEIEMSPNDLYVYTFEAPMGMNVENESDRFGARVDVPYYDRLISRQIYTNIHNTINKDDIVTKVAPGKWGFVRPGVDHELLEGREKADIEKMESILNLFGGYEHKYVGDKFVKPNFVLGNITKWFSYGDKKIEDFDSLSEVVLDVLNHSISKMRKKSSGANIKEETEETKEEEYKNNRAYYASNYERIFSKLISAVMTNKDEIKSVSKESKDDINELIKYLSLHKESAKKPFLKIFNNFSKKVGVEFGEDEKDKLFSLIYEADSWGSVYVIWNLKNNGKNMIKMHDPEVHLATLISGLNEEEREEYIKLIKGNEIDWHIVEKEDYEKNNKKDDQKAEGTDWHIVEKEDYEKNNKKDDQKSEKKDDEGKIEKQPFSQKVGETAADIIWAVIKAPGKIKKWFKK